MKQYSKTLGNSVFGILVKSDIESISAQKSQRMPLILLLLQCHGQGRIIFVVSHTSQWPSSAIHFLRKGEKDLS